MPAVAEVLQQPEVGAAVKVALEILQALSERAEVVALEILRALVEGAVAVEELWKPLAILD